jgi:hypothetical protein
VPEAVTPSWSREQEFPDIARASVPMNTKTRLSGPVLSRDFIIGVDPTASRMVTTRAFWWSIQIPTFLAINVTSSFRQIQNREKIPHKT